MLLSSDLVANLRRLVPLDAPIRIVDVGASDIHAVERPSYDPLLAHQLGYLTAFEPNLSEFARLESSEARRYLPYAIGDGSDTPFHITLSPGLCSTLQPNAGLLKHLKTLNRVSKVVSKSTMSTHRLDDLAEVGEIDFLKIDIQGGELKVFEGGRKQLSNVLCVQTEVAFVPLYEGQPLFAEQDAMLQSLGLRFYGMTSVNRFPLVGTPRNALGKHRRNDIGQWVDGDALFIRDFTEWEKLPYPSLKRLFFILALCFPAVSATLSIARRLVSAGQFPKDLYERLEAEASR
ncbi:MAG: FkbM family methyltransferase [Tabrizicola sp.]|jgi:FkbM family methyltransferase|uniref:FkbM family methyltransferase n=1 Tax=Tabrizicola sp. TaxID=2005166 RepID=UPI003BAF02FB|nr:FkbM family methyltransferase [Tabrizicola sp.]